MAVIRPAPMVLPPSRTAKLLEASKPAGFWSETLMWTRSPGITTWMSSGMVTVPVMLAVPNYFFLRFQLSFIL